MLGVLPESLTINGTEYEINTDYRIALLIFEAANDPETTQQEMVPIILYNLFCDEVEPEDMEEALKQAAWFLDGGSEYEVNERHTGPVINWTQDERYIFSAVNKVAGKEIRNEKQMHWWTFLALLSEIEDGMLAQIINIRKKKNENKKLDTTEQEFYEKNKKIIDIKTKEQKDDEKRINDLLGKAKYY